MRKKVIFITNKDIARLRSLIKSTVSTTQNAKRDIEKLKEELDRAKIVDTQNISQKVITMNSIVLLLDLDSEKEYTWRLVYPKDENIDQGRISVLAPLGTAILGYCEGDVFEWDVPSGTRRFKVMKVIYQPEASGDSNL